MAAKVKTINLSQYRGKVKKRRKGIHAKTKITKNKRGHLYKKISVGQS